MSLVDDPSECKPFAEQLFGVTKIRYENRSDPETAGPGSRPTGGGMVLDADCDPESVQAERFDLKILS